MKEGGCLALMEVAGLGVLGKADVNDADNVLGTRPDAAIAARQVKDWTTVSKKSFCEHGKGKKERSGKYFGESQRTVSAFLGHH